MSDDKPEWAKRNDEIHKTLTEAGKALKDKDTPISVEDLADNRIGDIARAEEERLVRTLFERIREAEVEVHDPQFVTDPEDLEPGTMDTSTERAGRIDAEGEPLTIDHIYDAAEIAESNGFRVDANGWEWWLHPRQLNNLRDDEDVKHHLAGAGPVLEAEEGEYAAEIIGTPIRTFPQFPRAAALLIDPETLEPEHAVGSRVPKAVLVRDPRRVVRITGLGLSPD